MTLKRFYVVIVIASLVLCSCVTTQLDTSMIKVDMNEDGEYSLKGKYHIYSGQSGQFYDILKKHTLVLNSKYNFLENIPS